MKEKLMLALVAFTLTFSMLLNAVLIAEHLR